MTVALAVAQTPIKGEPQLSADELTAYIAARNSDFDPAIAHSYIEIGRRYGIRGDIALCQAILETGWFRYEGSAVEPSDHNYCGLGVVTNGERGNGFDTVEEGVRAHIQHLFAYSSTRKLPSREPLSDPRFALVSRGSATTWEALGGRWAANPAYGQRILDILSRIIAWRDSL